MHAQTNNIYTHMHISKETISILEFYCVSSTENGGYFLIACCLSWQLTEDSCVLDRIAAGCGMYVCAEGRIESLLVHH